MEINKETQGINDFQPLTQEEQDIKVQLYDKLLSVMDLSLIETISKDQAREQISEISSQLLNEFHIPINLATRKRLIKLIIDEVLGLGPLETLLADPSISDILVNSFDRVYIERRGKLEPVNIKFHSNVHLLNIIDRIVSSVGRRIDESSPMVDARLADGSRVNAIIPPLALDGPSLSIRRFAVDKLNAKQLIDIGSVTESMIELLKGAVKGKLNILVSGGTGSGKTTLLNMLSGFIPSDERIVTIEDSAELQLQQPHTVRLETRPQNIEGKGEVSQRDLVKNCLRMRPDRIVIGEVRGGEALDMLTAMNTGHEGSLTTLHANSPRDALGRLEYMVCMAGFDMPVSNIRTQVASAIDLVVQLERQEDGRRRITSIQEINGMEGDIITMSEIFRFSRQGLDEDGQIKGEFEATGVIPGFHTKLKLHGIELPYNLFNCGDPFAEF
ncbi:pilus assembly protein CpaF [Shewanella sp. Choline-02u-19]|uniref:CpaF family protein n=1 Tax=unclassified Shewanella TaxID=196818 RepID=UPI000C33E585|nr:MULTISPECIES: CpaF family protein [unclassified Shewanella]PKG57316.1 pilus assembly protein CpaF [Shewanella sp. GutDb-MelDb]PKH62887.1 pilus assembly protein CpaF [Shewanella sp. Bg11-22]PKI27608.1 pilus assembly protein CpaF [Shewanella sp. Choline-02u-19]